MIIPLTFLFILSGCAHKDPEPMMDVAVKAESVEQPIEENTKLSSSEKLKNALKKRDLPLSHYADLFHVLYTLEHQAPLDESRNLSNPLQSFTRSDYYKERAKIRHEESKVNATPQNALEKHPLSVRRARAAIQKARDADDRKAIKLGYLQLVRAYEKDAPQDQIAIIDNYLWLARYEGLFGEYKEAQSSVRKALINVKKARKNKSYKRKQQLQINDLEIEAYFTLASRIHIEQKNTKAARKNLVDAAKVSPRSKEWDERLFWFQGLYAYMDQDMTSALTYWETLLSTTKSHDLKQSLMYWLSRTYQNLNNPSRADEYVDLLKKLDPTSFYLLHDESYKLGLTQENSLIHSLPFNTKDPLHNNHQLIYALMESDLNELAFFYIQDFQKQLVNRFGFNSSQIPTFLYVARLYSQANAHLHGISLSTEVLRTFPEAWDNHRDQIFYYYPLAYIHYFRRADIAPAIGLAITRQESGFYSRAKSSAGAYGLMQMIAKTAERYLTAPEDPLSKQRLEQLHHDPTKILFNPAQSVELGTRYLKDLLDRYDQQPHLAFAAYNAGEFAVDQWVKNRRHEDTLLWVELIPFAQTRHYVKSVWRNKRIYQKLLQDKVATH
jgi:soluble lytic murein transglycosylase-like protein